jgi:hypothetical protein
MPVASVLTNELGMETAQLPQTQQRRIDGTEVAHQLRRARLRYFEGHDWASYYGGHALNGRRLESGLRPFRRHSDDPSYAQGGNSAGFRYRRIADDCVELYHHDWSQPTAEEVERLRCVALMARMAPGERSLWILLVDNPHLAIQAEESTGAR